MNYLTPVPPFVRYNVRYDWTYSTFFFNLSRCRYVSPHFYLDYAYIIWT